MFSLSICTSASYIQMADNGSMRKEADNGGMGREIWQMRLPSWTVAQ